MRRSRTSAIVALLQFLSLLALWLSVSPAARGQEEFPAPTEEQEKGALLTDSLRRLAYDPARNGPLFAVALPTDRTRKETRSLRSVADVFGRKIVTIGNITVLAPREMTLITVPTGKPDAAKDLGPGDAFTLLIESLTDAQFALLSGDGLTRADLMGDAQSSLFDALFPKPVEVYPARLFHNAHYQAVELQRTDADKKSLTAGELRLRIFRQAEVTTAGESGAAVYNLIGDNRRDEEFVWLKKFDSFDTDSLGTREPPHATAFGRAVYPRVPSRLKFSELDYAASALNVAIPLTEREKTLGEIIARVAEATGLELHADRRVAVLPAVWRVSSSGPQTARAGDVLEALAWSITGAFRRLGPRTFLLTDDIDGIGTRMERLARWRAGGDEARQERANKATTRITERKLLSRLVVRPDDPLHLTPQQEKRLAADARENLRGLEIPTGELPDALRDRALRAAEGVGRSDAATLDRRTVNISLEPKIVVLAPDGKRVADLNNEFGDIETALHNLQANAAFASPAPDSAAPAALPEPPPFQISPKVKRRVLIVSLQGDATTGDATETVLLSLIPEAKKRGFTEVWVSVSLAKTGDSDLAFLNAAIAAGRKAGLPVGAIVSLLRDTGEIAGLEPDLNLLGEADGKDFPGFWLAPTETAAAELARRAARLAAVPGLSGLAIRNAFARGYFTEPEGGSYGESALEYQRGYIAPFRLSFVRDQSIDPVDMPSNPTDSGPLPFFPEEALQDAVKLVEGRTVRDAAKPGAAWSWRRFREKKSLAALAAVFAAVKQAAPKLPLYQSERLADMGEKSPGFFVEWGAADGIIRRPRFSDEVADLGAARAVSPLALLSLPPAVLGLPNKWTGGREDKTRFDEFFSFVFGEMAQNADGAVLDLSPLSPADSLKCLREGFAAP